jgi:hypothetical protein
MCRVNRWHTREYKISTRVLLDRLGLESIDTHVARWQLGLLGKHGEWTERDWHAQATVLLGG